jgi:AP endonuclease 1
MPRPSPRKANPKPAVVETTKVKKTVVKTNGSDTKSVTITKGTVEVKKTSSKKRASPQDEDLACESHDEKEETKPTKRRKTTGKKDDNMILENRTAIASLKHAMYIGAHVSGAGGKPDASRFNKSLEPRR